jgi:hypothetical protein
MIDKTEELAIRIILLEDALKTANDVLSSKGSLGVLPQSTPNDNYRDDTEFMCRLNDLIND